MNLSSTLKHSPGCCSNC